MIEKIIKPPGHTGGNEQRGVPSGYVVYVRWGLCVGMFAPITTASLAVWPDG